MKKIISILIAVAMLASLTVIAITSVSAAEETVYSVPLTDDNWLVRKQIDGYSDISINDADSSMNAEEGDGYIKFSLKDENQPSFPSKAPDMYTKVKTGDLVVKEDDKINLDFVFHVGSNANGGIQGIKVVLGFASGEVEVQTQLGACSDQGYLWSNRVANTDVTVDKTFVMSELMTALSKTGIFADGQATLNYVTIKYGNLQGVYNDTTTTMQINDISFTRTVADSSSSEETSSVPTTGTVKYAVPTDPSAWGTWLLGNPTLDNTDQLSAEKTADGAMKVWFPATAESQSPNFLINNGGGLVQVEKGDKLHVDVTVEGTPGIDDTRWFLEIGFSAAGTTPARINISKYIGEAAGFEANASGQLPQGEYDVVLDIEEIIKTDDAENGRSNYDKIFGEDGNNWLTTVNINYVTTDPAGNSDKDQAFILNEIAVGDANAFTGEDPSTPSDGSWSLVEDATTDTNVQWRDFGNGTGGAYPDFDDITAFDINVTDDVISFTNFTGATGSTLGFEGGDAKTFFTVKEGDMLNVNLRYTTPGNAGWSWKVSLYNKATQTYVNLSEAIAEASGAAYSPDGGGFLTTAGTDVIASIDLADIMGVGTEVNYIQFYLAFAGQSADTALTINEFSVTNKDDTSSSSTPSSSSETPSSSETQSSSDVQSSSEAASSSSETSTSSNASTTTSTTTSTASTTSNTSSVAQVDTGEALVPIIAVAALAVVSASAVVISKKRSK